MRTAVRRFRAHTLGVEEGDVLLFDDFESEGPMWTGKGPREVSIPVRFGESFSGLPSVWAGLMMWDIASVANARVDLRTEEVTREGFTLRFRTWGDTSIARARARWQALGPLRDDDDWGVD